MINITRRGWNHIAKYHTVTQSSTHANKRKFNAGEDLVELINQASQSRTAIGDTDGTRLCYSDER